MEFSSELSTTSRLWWSAQTARSAQSLAASRMVYVLTYLHDISYPNGLPPRGPKVTTCENPLKNSHTNSTIPIMLSNCLSISGPDFLKRVFSYAVISQWNTFPCKVHSPFQFEVLAVLEVQGISSTSPHKMILKYRYLPAHVAFILFVWWSGTMVFCDLSFVSTSK